MSVSESTWQATNSTSQQKHNASHTQEDEQDDSASIQTMMQEEMEVQG